MVPRPSVLSAPSAGVNRIRFSGSRPISRLSAARAAPRGCADCRRLRGRWEDSSLFLICSISITSIRMRATQSWRRHMADDLYRYFISIRPPRFTRAAIAAARDRVRPRNPVPNARAHVTLAGILFGPKRERAVRSLVEAALTQHELCACPVTLSRVECNAGADGIAMLVSGTNRDGLVDLREGLVRRLLKQWPDMPVNTSFRPHLTLGYAPSQDSSWKTEPIHWQAEEIELIESHHGYGEHRRVGRWRLLPAPQYELDFMQSRSLSDGL